MPNVKQSHSSVSGVADNACVRLVGVHVPELHWDEIDHRGVVDHSADEDAIVVFEPIVVGVVPTDMRIDRCRHCRNVTDTGNVPGHDHQAGKPPACRLTVVGLPEVFGPSGTSKEYRFAVQPAPHHARRVRPSMW